MIFIYPKAFKKSRNVSISENNRRVLSPYLTTVHCGYKMYCVIWFKMAAHNRPLPSKTSTATLKIVMGEKTLHFLSHWYEIAPSKLSREAFKGLDLHLGLLCKWILWGASLSKKKVIVSWNLTERKSSSSKFRDCLIWIVYLNHNLLNKVLAIL